MELKSVFNCIMSSVALSSIASIAACSSVPPGERSGESSAAITTETLTLLQVEEYAEEAGLPCGTVDPASGYHSLAVAGAVAEAESGLCTSAIGMGGMGLWQIQNGGSVIGTCSPNPDQMEVVCPTAPQQVSCQGGDWTDPAVNARWMAIMSANGTSWGPWCTYGNCCGTACASAPYLQHIVAAESAYDTLCTQPPRDGGPEGGGGPTGYGIVTTPSGGGYWQWMSNGAVYSWGDAHYHGGANAISGATSPIVGMARDATGGGYWQVAKSGKVYAFGDAANKGGLDTIPHSSPAVGIASDGTGYWVVTENGAIYSFGAPYHGGAGGISHAPIVAIAATTDGGGYWLLASDGAIYSYGASYHGGLNTISHSSAVAGFAAAASGGYWIATQDGAVYSFDATYEGGANTIAHSGHIVGIGATTGSGYWESTSDGAIYSFGNARYHGGANTL